MFSPHAGERRTTPGEESVMEQVARPIPMPLASPQTTEDDGRRESTRPATTAPRDLTTNVPGMALWLRRADQFLLGGLLIALVILLMIARWKLSGGGRTEIEVVSQQPRAYFYAIDINRASWVEWAQLDGIGEKLARRIVQDREEQGPFQSVTDVGRVRGLGPKLMEKLTPFLRGPGDSSAPSDGPR